MTKKKQIKLAIVCPCYNEEDVLYASAEKLLVQINSLVEKKKISKDSFVCFVNDGSVDNTWNILQDLHNKNSVFKAVDLAYNAGHQNAIMAGMMYALDKVDACITIDVDLQDDINCIELMVDKYAEGYDVVYGVKTDRSADGIVKRTTAGMFYGLQSLMGIEIIKNHADFRLVSNKVLKSLSQYRETNLYLRGIIPSLGFKSCSVNDVIGPRSAGKSKYSKKKMFKLATDGVTSFSSTPLKIIFWIGVIFLIVALINVVDVIVSLVQGTAMSGWSQLMLSLWFIGGVILISLGLVGLYIGRIYTEAKGRPRYIVNKNLD